MSDHDIRIEDSADRIGGANSVPVVIGVPAIGAPAPAVRADDPAPAAGFRSV